MGYTNLGQHASELGIINNNINQFGPNPREELEKHCAPRAAFDSAARFDPPRCAESTRLQIIRIIEEWVNKDGGDTVSSSLFWLHGDAGVGKSALAQSLSEKFQEKKQLAASFFFCRNDATRNHGENLIPTLVSHLVCSFKEIVPFIMDGIRENPALFTKRFQTQIQELLVEPLQKLLLTGAVVSHPRLVVIDGLDECENSDVPCQLLRVIARAIPLLPYPLRFLITSRPEPHITDVFHHDPPLQAITAHIYNLGEDPDADVDIRKVLDKEFEKIRRIHNLGHPWPDQEAITSLVKQSSGHFLYALNVVRYIRSPDHRPDDRLEVILRLQDPAQVDDLLLETKLHNKIGKSSGTRCLAAETHPAIPMSNGTLPPTSIDLAVVRDELKLSGYYLADNAHQNVVWKRIGRCNTLVTKQSAEHDTSGRPTNLERAILYAVITVNHDNCFLTPCGNWKGPTANTPHFKDLKLSFRGGAPIDDVFRSDFQSSVNNARTLIQLAVPDTTSKGFVMSQVQPLSESLQFRHVVFEQKLHEEDDQDPDSDTFALANWPTIHQNAKDAKQALVNTHRVNPLLAYKRNGDLIHPTAYQSSLAGATVRVGFWLNHWCIPQKGENCFTADIDTIRVLIEPTRLKRRRVATRDPGINQPILQKRKTTH